MFGRSLIRRLAIPERSFVYGRGPITLLYRKYSADIKEIKEESDSKESDTSASTTGVIDQSKSDILIYYDQLNPWGANYSSLIARVRGLLRPLTDKLSTEENVERIRKNLSPLPEGVKVSELIPLKRDSGAFVKFSIPADLNAKEFITKINNNLRDHNDSNNKNPIRFFLNKIYDTQPKIFTVKGTPWIEDLKRYPSNKLKVNFEGHPLTEEELYLLLRRYGFINDILPEGQSATIIFRHVRSAIRAKHCLTGLSLSKGATTLHMQFIPVKRFKVFIDVIVNHQKIAVPIIIALLAAFAVLIFDPIREWCIELKITKKYALTTYLDNRYVQILLIPYYTIVNWLNSGYDYLDKQISDKFTSSSSAEDDNLENLDVNMLWSERYEKSKQLQLWIHENVNTFIVVKGPQGSGKEEFVIEHSLTDDPTLVNKVLSIDCDKLVKSRTDNHLISNTALQLGYFPVFTWTNSISQFIDLAVQGITGQKSGLSESKEAQIKNMFSLTNTVIRKLALNNYKRYVASANKKNAKNLKKGEEAVDVLGEEDFMAQHPECKPIIVVSKYARRSIEPKGNDFIYLLISDWAAGLVQNNLAHVVFITSDVGSIPQLAESLPNQVFKTISLSDASCSGAKQFLTNQLKLKDSDVIDECLEPLGGRMLDLQAIVRRIKSGEKPLDALDEMITQAAEQITTFFLNSVETNGNNWNTAQIWALMKALSANDHIDYEDLVKIPVFGDSPDTNNTLSALEKHDMLTLKRVNGVLDQILTGRPIYRAAFKKLIEDKKIYKLYEINYLSKLLKMEGEKIKKLEEELVSIHKLGDKLSNRIAYISQKIENSNAKIVAYESKISEINSPTKKQSGILSKVGLA